MLVTGEFYEEREAYLWVGRSWEKILPSRELVRYSSWFFFSFILTFNLESWKYNVEGFSGTIINVFIHHFIIYRSVNENDNDQKSWQIN